MELNADHRRLPLTEQGFLKNLNDWDEDVAMRLAEIDHIVLTDQHWEILHFARTYYTQFKHLPNARMFAKAIATALGPDKANSRYLQRLFPQGPLKYAFKLAGLPKPPTCL